MTTLLFVCTGNICRSPMAVAIAHSVAHERGMELSVASAGTAALAGEPAMQHVREVLGEIGLDVLGHAARQVDAQQVEAATLVVTATNRHADWLRQLSPHAAGKIRGFDELTGLGDIPDPISGDVDAYRAVRDLLLRGMPSVLDVLRKQSGA